MQPRLALLLKVASVSFALGALALIACAEEARENDLAGVEGDGKKKKDDPQDPTPEIKAESDPLLPDGGKPPGRVFAHTNDTLYLFDPLVRPQPLLQEIGKFKCLQAGDEVLDIAVDRGSIVYATTRKGFMLVQPIDATCTYVVYDPSEGTHYPNSLAFVPMGQSDVLVGYTFVDNDGSELEATVYSKIDTANGAITRIGDLNAGTGGGGKRWMAAGDLIALLRNGKSYLTVREIGTDDATAPNSLAEIDPADGKIKSIIGSIGKSQLYGLGQWAGTAYGFSGNGEVVQIDVSNARATVVTQLQGNKAWFGAGMTTDSPTKP